MTNPILAELVRGPIVESFHRGAYAVCDADGRVLASAGDIGRPVYPRSAVKVLQALPLVASGAADHYGLDDRELALACASHGGEPEHVRTAAAVLSRLGLDETVLECGSHWPNREQAARALAAAGQEPGPLHNNCSGKHAGFVCLGCHLASAAGAAPRDFLRGYVDPSHPVMREVGAAIEAATGVSLAQAPMATDGCSIPTWALPLERLATGFARIATGERLSPEHQRAARRLRAAVAASPFHVAGTDRFDTRVMTRFGERVFCKVGAEGVYCAALPAAGLGIAIKMDDGNTARAVEVVMAAMLARWLPHGGPALDDADQALLDALSHVPVHNWRGIRVGEIRARDEVS
jgi:L-asparaginase II